MDCPNCGNKHLYRDSVDNGVMVIHGPYGCHCGWSEWDEYNQLLGNGGQSKGGYIDTHGGFTPTPKEKIGDE